MLPGMADDPPVPTPDADPQAEHLPALPAGPSAAGQAALAEAQRLARQATAPATLRAYRADWQHFADWCARAGFVPVPAEPAVVGAYLASLADSHAPEHHPPSPRRTGQDAPVQRPAMEPGAS